MEERGGGNGEGGKRRKRGKMEKVRGKLKK